MDTRLPWDRRKACGCLKVNGARSFAASALMLAGLACGPSNPPAPLYGVPIDQITSDLPKYIGVTAVIYGYLHSSVTLHPAADVEGRRPGLSFADVDIRESLFILVSDQRLLSLPPCASTTTVAHERSFSSM
jgi:hypothetical protein